MTNNELESIEILVDQYRQDLIADIERRKRINLTKNSNDKYEYYRDCISDYFGMPKDKLFNLKSRKATIIFARQILCWVCNVGETALPWKLMHIADKIGYANHSGVYHSIEELKVRLEMTRTDRMTVKEILEMMGYELVKENDKYTNRYKHENTH